MDPIGSGNELEYMRPQLASTPISQSAEDSHWYYGVLLDAVATLAGAGGKQLLRAAAVTGNAYLYPLGLFLTAVIDPAFDLAAYSYTAQSIIAACAGLVIVWNVLLAPFTLGEELTAARIWGAVLICAGTVGVGIFGNHEEVDRTSEEYIELFLRPTACAYYIAFSFWVIVSCRTYCHAPHSVAGSFCLCALAGSMAGNSFSTKAAVEMAEEPLFYIEPTFYVAASISLVNAVLSLYLLAVSLQGYEALYMITVYQGFFVISGAISGNFVMNEKEGQSWYDLASYSAGICVVLCGLLVLLRGELSPAASSKRAERLKQTMV